MLAQPALAGETVRISGTGSGVGGMQLLAEAFMSAHPGNTVEVLPARGSAGGISALMAGKLEPAVTNRPLSLWQDLSLVAGAKANATAQQFIAFVSSHATRKLLCAHRHLPR